MTISNAEEIPRGSRNRRRPTPVVTLSISSRNERRSRISELGDDLLLEILIRSFPNPKSACRCKAVCKQWRSLISSPSFNRRFVSHHQKKKKNTKLLLQNELVSVISSFLPPMPDRVTVGGQTLLVFDCFKDLVLCGFWDADRRIDIRKPIRSYLICNPFTQKWISLPLAPSNYGCGTLVARLVCEPSISTTLDLGDDEQSPFIYSEYRFRVVCLYEDVGNMSLKLDVFCSESGEWISRALVLDRHIMRQLTDPCSCNEQLFWTSTILGLNSPKNLTGDCSFARCFVPDPKQWHR
ncbi:Putative F-box/kelch-repeat protein At4g22430 [Linum grandiflorum]